MTSETAEIAPQPEAMLLHSPGKVIYHPSGLVTYEPPHGVGFPLFFPMRLLDPQELKVRMYMDSCPSKMLQAGVGGIVI